ncbi:Cullin family protein [Thraustotheca clavata]|uniref:Cullin family protein n=1 Tax=Thraustotheca clavata TaxID=74557 RepID=A0A1W0AA01_9STRA|nr:Cullin family protein [Thraustotheca clavata]
MDDLLCLWRAVRNGAFYGTKIRAPHALVMVFLFHKKPFREQLQAIVKLTFEHTKNLASFVGVYKASLLALKVMHGGHPLGKSGLNPIVPWHAAVAGAIGGYAVWSKYSNVNYQIIMYLFSRVLIGLVKLLSEKGAPILKDYSFKEVYPVLACVTWGLVMWLFEYHGHVLHPSLKKSMDFLYHESNTWTSIADFLPSPANVAIFALTWMNICVVDKEPYDKKREMKKARKVSIKPFKQAPSVPEGFEERAWQSLEASLLCLHKKVAAPTLGWEELYGLVTDLCHQKKAAWLYALLKAHLASTVNRTLKTACVDHEATMGLLNMESTLFVDRLVQLWEEFCSDLLMIRNLCLYLDRTYVMQTAGVLSIYDMGLQCFQEALHALPALETKITASFLREVERERHGETVGRATLKLLVRMTSSLQIYGRHIERPFLAGSEVFYAAEGQSQMEAANVASFLLHVEKRLVEENERSMGYMDGNLNTKKAILHVVETYLFAPHAALVLERGFEDLATGHRIEDLKRLFNLFERIDQLPLLKASWTRHIVTHGSSIVNDTSPTSLELDKGMVASLLTFKENLDKMLNQAFRTDVNFVHALKSAMEQAINAKPSRPAELIAKFVDAKLKTGNKDGSEREIEALLDRVMVLFRYIQGKDVFEAFYKKDLAKRLLLGKSASFDLEKAMISKLKTECGSSFTNKLEGMFKDIDLSRSVMVQFQQHHASQLALSNLKQKMDMQVHVLTTGFWPPYVPTEINMPAVLLPLKSIFESFYTAKYQGRQLQWQHSLGHCLVKSTFPKGRKELAVSLFQALVLFCFNGRDVIGFKEIKEQTGIEDGELRRTLQSLACGKVRVLQKQPKGRDVNDDDEFHYNAQFTNPLMRIKINSIQMKETTTENTETHERVFRDRQYQVDAAIVRIMKSRKQLSHALLMSELLTQLKFPAKPVDIKRRIESLIDREYLERDASNTQLYNYLA